MFQLLFPNHCAYCEQTTNTNLHVCETCLNSLKTYKAHVSTENTVRVKLKKYYDNVFFIYQLNPVLEAFFLDIKNYKCKDYYKTIPTFLNQLPKEAQKILKKSNFITYIPSYKRVNQDRGFEHGERLATITSSVWDIPVLKTLSKDKKTKFQKELDKQERQINLKNVFTCLPDLNEVLDHKKVLVIDDICTTGSTITEFAKTLKKTHQTVKLTAITIAKA